VEHEQPLIVIWKLWFDLIQLLDLWLWLMYYYLKYLRLQFLLHHQFNRFATFRVKSELEFLKYFSKKKKLSEKLLFLYFFSIFKSHFFRIKSLDLKSLTCESFIYYPTHTKKFLVLFTFKKKKVHRVFHTMKRRYFFCNF